MVVNFSIKEKTNIHLLTKEEAEIFGIFIYQEMNRHQQDIKEAQKLIYDLNCLFDIDIPTLYLLKSQRCEPDCKFVLYGIKCKGCHYD